MSIDLSRLTPAPWKTDMLTIHTENRTKDGPTEQVEVVTPEHDMNTWRVDVICRCDCTRGKYEYEEANAEFIALARNAFDGDPEALAWWEANRTIRPQQSPENP